MDHETKAPGDNGDLSADLCKMLTPRQALGWRIANSTQCWYFGLGGAARLVANVHYGRLHLFDHARDEDLFFLSSAGMLETVRACEVEYRGLTPSQQHIIGEWSGDFELDILESQMSELARQDEAFDIRDK
jgi:hypothetical protein